MIAPSTWNTIPVDVLAKRLVEDGVALNIPSAYVMINVTLGGQGDVVEEIVLPVKGGPGSGYHNEPGNPHRGRPGERGGSSPSDAGPNTEGDYEQGDGSIVFGDESAAPAQAPAAPAVGEKRVPRPLADGMNGLAKVFAGRYGLRSDVDRLNKIASEFADVLMLDKEVPLIDVWTELPDIYESIPDNIGGVYIRKNGKGKGIAIYIPARGYAKEMSYAHEMGHHLDMTFMRIGDPSIWDIFRRRGPEFDAAIDQYRKAIDNSLLIMGIRQAAEDTPSDGTHRTMRMNMVFDGTKRLFTYLTEDREIWARAFAQWMARKTQNPQMLKQLKILQNRDLTPTQWEDDDFAPIESAMDSLFGQLGWLR